MKLRYFIPSCIVLMFIFGFSSQNGHESSQLSNYIYDIVKFIPINKDTLIFIIRKCAHMTEFGLLALSLYYGFYKNHIDKSMRYAIMFTFIFACFDEIHQLFIVDRVGQIQDCFIDLAGGILFLNIYKLIRKVVFKGG